MACSDLLTRKARNYLLKRLTTFRCFAPKALVVVGACWFPPLSVGVAPSLLGDWATPTWGNGQPFPIEGMNALSLMREPATVASNSNQLPASTTCCLVVGGWAAVHAGRRMQDGGWSVEDGGWRVD